MRQTKEVSVETVCFIRKPQNVCTLTELIIADVEAFAKAMETETKSDQDGDSKDKKEEDEDMSLD